MAEERASALNYDQAGALFGKSRSWVKLLQREGFIKSEKGKFDLVPLVRGVLSYYEHLLQKSEKKAAATRVTDARTREIEMRIAERQRELIPLDDAKGVLSQFAAMVRAELTGLPARLTRNPAERHRLEQEVDGSLRRLSAQAGASEGALGTGLSDTGASGEAAPG